jgi:hypothetical protein
MSKVTIEFNLPEEQSEYEVAHNAAKYLRVLTDFDQYLRNLIKYKSDTTEYKNFNPQMAREELNRILQENNIDIYEI